ncbi:MAG: GFA family protein, partial [Myxococcales bacterium]|nr:GFA family protein [Myxococcales bacterium]
MTHVGHCQCGGVTVTLSAEPVDACYCHCSICRRSTGAPLIAVVVMPEGGMEITLAEGVTLN